MQGTGPPVRKAISAAVLAAGLPALPAQAGELQVRLDHLIPGAPLRVALYTSAAAWSRGGPAYAVRELKPAGLVELVDFQGLPPGQYAVRARQETAPASLDMGPLLLTLGRQGDSGGAQRGSFERAAVPVADEDPQVRVHLFTDSGY